MSGSVIASSGPCQLSVRVRPETVAAIKALARRRHVSVSQLFRSWMARDLTFDSSDNLPDEATIREMAILIAVELGLKLQELSLPGGASRSRELLEAAARAAMERLDMVEASLERIER